MINYKREYRDIVAIAKFEPSFKCVYVEGISDYYFIKDFLKYHNCSDVGVYMIDSLDLTEILERVENREQYDLYKSSNKKQVILLAHSLENEPEISTVSLLCVVDRDWDFVTNTIETGKFLVYTDYNSMEVYLFNVTVINKFLTQGLRINNVEVTHLMDSIAEVCRIVFHVRCITNDDGIAMIHNDRDVSFNKNNYTCSLDFNSFWHKNMVNRGLYSRSGELMKLFEARMSHACDNRMEIRGHDYVHYLYYCVKRIKTKLSMSEEEFSNMFWAYANHEDLKQEQLFIRILAL